MESSPSTPVIAAISGLPVLAKGAGGRENATAARAQAGSWGAAAGAASRGRERRDGGECAPALNERLDTPGHSPTQRAWLGLGLGLG